VLAGPCNLPRSSGLPHSRDTGDPFKVELSTSMEKEMPPRTHPAIELSSYCCCIAAGSKMWALWLTGCFSEVPQGKSAVAQHL